MSFGKNSKKYQKSNIKNQNLGKKEEREIAPLFYL
jgi:hypothetical protein